MIKFNNFLKFSKSVRLGILLFTGIVVVLLVIVFVDLFNKNLRVSFYDIGQGDAVFIETPENYQILIDGGPSPNILRKLGRDMIFWDKTIDLIIATHPDSDHISGLIDVLKRYKVKNFLISPIISKDTDVFKVFYQAIWNEGARLYLAEAGQSFSDINFKVLYPFEFTEYKPLGDFNDMSIVNLLKSISPNLAIIQVGKDNYYKHPHISVIERFQNFGIPIWRTDLDGDLKLRF